jgi:DNA-binding MarR family transcriptional regulator
MADSSGHPTGPSGGRLQREIRQNRPFHSKGQEAFLSLLRTGDVVKHRFHQLFEAAGVTFQQYNVLRILRGAGEEGLATLEIGDRMIERTPGITRLLDRLEEKGLVLRERSPQDRRKVVCTISPVGLELLASLDTPVVEADDEVFRGMDEADLETLIRILDRLRDQIEAEAD